MKCQDIFSEKIRITSATTFAWHFRVNAPVCFLNELHQVKGSAYVKTADLANCAISL